MTTACVRWWYEKLCGLSPRSESALHHYGNAWHLGEAGSLAAYLDTKGLAEHALTLRTERARSLQVFWAPQIAEDARDDREGERQARDAFVSKCRAQLRLISGGRL
jgi:hypothetical protein